MSATDNEVQVLESVLLGLTKPKNFKQYCEHWDQWKANSHSPDENRAEAVKRMKQAYKVSAISKALIPGASTLSLVLEHGLGQPKKSFYADLDLSSLGLSSLPDWLPPVQNVNLENNRLTTVPTHLFRQLNEAHMPSFKPPTVQLANNPIPADELYGVNRALNHPASRVPTVILSMTGPSAGHPSAARPSAGQVGTEAEPLLPRIT